MNVLPPPSLSVEWGSSSPRNIHIPDFLPVSLGLAGFKTPFPHNPCTAVLFHAEIEGQFAFPPWNTGFHCPTMTSPEIDVPPEILHRGVLQLAPYTRLKHKKMDAGRRGNHRAIAIGLSRPLRRIAFLAFVFPKEILDSREGMTAELQYSSSKNRTLLPNRRMNPRTRRGAIRKPRVYASFPHPLHRLHNQYVQLQDGNVAALLLVETPPVSLVSVNSNDNFPAPGALATVQQHCTGSAAFRLRSFLLNVNHYFGGQL